MRIQSLPPRSGRAPIVTLVLLLASVVIATMVPTAAQADPRSGVTRIERTEPRLATVWVYSPSMRREIPNTVLIPDGDRPAPVFYLLNGRGGGLEGDSWARQTRYRQFFAGENVYVVSPLGGRYSWSADWRSPDPALGVNRWETYLTRELPDALSSRFRTTGRAAIAGVSMTGGSALDIAGRAGPRFSAAASYSGCPVTSGPIGQTIVSAVTAFGGGNPVNLYGPPTDRAWVDHDPSRNPNRLRGKAVYIGSAVGTPGPIDGPPSVAASLVAGPSQVEAITNWCSDQLAGSLRAARVPHVRKVFGTGAHTWNLFEAELRDSWRVIGPALGA